MGAWGAETYAGGRRVVNALRGAENITTDKLAANGVTTRRAARDCKSLQPHPGTFACIMRIMRRRASSACGVVQSFCSVGRGKQSACTHACVCVFACAQRGAATTR